MRYFFYCYIPAVMPFCSLTDDRHIQGICSSLWSSTLTVLCFLWCKGVVQGMITGIRGLCNGLGPALYGFVFYLFHVELTDSEGAGKGAKPNMVNPTDEVSVNNKGPFTQAVSSLNPATFLKRFCFRSTERCLFYRAV